jgi:hypothetical protein
LAAGDIIKYEFAILLTPLQFSGTYSDVTVRAVTSDIRVKMESIDTVLQEGNPVEVARFRATNEVQRFL